MDTQPTQNMDTSELIRRVRKIEIKSKGLSKHLFAGAYHSAFKGRGMSFSEVRNYQYGDDVRSIDWNVTARYDEPFVKVFEEERELTVMLLVDVSRSALFGSQGNSKREIITEISAVLAFAAINNNDKVGVLFFSDRVEQYIPPRKGKTHILRIIRELLHLTPQSVGTDVGLALRYLNNVQKKRSTAFVLSDFVTGQPYEDALRIAGKRHDVIGVRLYDQRDYDLPDVGLVRLQDLETGDQLWLDTSRASERERYRKAFEERQAAFEVTFTKAGLDTLSVRTDEAYAPALQQFFNARK